MLLIRILYGSRKLRQRRGSLDFPVEYRYVTCHQPRYHMPYHWHIEYEILRVLSGKIQLTPKEKTILAEAGDLLFISDGIVHDGAAKGMTACTSAASTISAISSRRSASTRARRRINSLPRTSRQIFKQSMDDLMANAEFISPNDKR